MTKRLTTEEIEEIRKRTYAAIGKISIRAVYPEKAFNVLYGDVPALLEEVEALRAENSRLCPIGDLSTIDTLRTEIKYRDDIIAEKDTEIARLRDALEFYGDQFNYANYAEIIRNDFGSRAREAIRNDSET